MDIGVGAALPVFNTVYRRLRQLWRLRGCKYLCAGRKARKLCLKMTASCCVSLACSGQWEAIPEGCAVACERPRIAVIGKAAGRAFVHQCCSSGHSHTSSGFSGDANSALRGFGFRIWGSSSRSFCWTLLKSNAVEEAYCRQPAVSWCARLGI